MTQEDLIIKLYGQLEKITQDLEQIAKHLAETHDIVRAAALAITRPQEVTEEWIRTHLNRPD